MSKITFEIDIDSLPLDLYEEVRDNILESLPDTGGLIFHPQKDGTILINALLNNLENVTVITIDFLEDAAFVTNREDRDADSFEYYSQTLNNYMAVKDNLSKAISVIKTEIKKI